MAYKTPEPSITSNGNVYLRPQRRDFGQYCFRDKSGWICYQTYADAFDRGPGGTAYEELPPNAIEIL